MTKITITINTKTAAFNDGNSGQSEAARILRELADRLEDGKRVCWVWDLNGNIVGTMTIKE